MMQAQRYYFSTRDLLMMAALAALGGIASTYINFIGDFFQSFLGFAGTTQWAAGLHVLWLVLAVGLTRKTGAGTVTGILKGAVELFSGNTHGMLVLLVDLVAGILVDLGALPFRRKEGWLSYALAGGLAAASNVIVFQLFAAIPADFITVGLISLIALVAFISGVIFAGILGTALLAAMRRSGVVKNQEPHAPGRSTWPVLLAAGVILAGGLLAYLKLAQGGGNSIAVSGAAAAPYQFSPGESSLAEKVVAVESGGASASYRGYPLAEIIDLAEPDPEADLALLTASDGYAFFISLEELGSNPGIVLQAQGSGEDLVFNIAGPASKKAWVNGVVEIQIIQSAPLPLAVGNRVVPFQPADWISEMDSAYLDVGDGARKYQGVPLGLIVAASAPGLEAGELTAFGIDNSLRSFAIDEVLADEGIRVFINFGQGTTSYVLANLDGEVYLPALERIQVP